MVKASSAPATQIDHQAHDDDGEHREQAAEAERFAGRDAPLRDRTVGRAGHDGVDIGFVGHIERAGRAGADGDAQKRREADHRMDMDRRDHEADERREHHERHHPRLEQREIIADGGDARLKTRVVAQCRHLASPHLIFGSTENWWNGGGEVSVHSSVVAPAPHGLFAAFSLRRKACDTPNRKTNTPKAERYEP